MSNNQTGADSNLITDLEKTLFDNVHLAIAVVDQDRILVRVNDTFCRMFGYSDPSEPIGLSASTFHLSPQKYQEFGQLAFEKVLKNQKVSVPYQFKRKDGTVFWGQISGQLINNDQAVVWMIADITQWRALLQQLKRDEEKYRLLSDYATDVVWVLDLPSLQFSYFSPSVFNLRGYTPEEAMRLSLEETLTPESCRKAKEYIAESLKRDRLEGCHHNRVRYLEFEEICRDRSVIHTEAIVRYIRNEQGDPIQVIGSTRDITERKRAEKKLKESEEKFRTVFATIPEPVAITRVIDGVYVDVNDQFVQLSAYSREELIGHSSLTVNIWANPDDRAKMVDGLKKEGKVENLAAEFVSKDGLTIYGLMSARIVEIDGEKYILSITRDLTARRLAEEKYATLIKEANVGIGLADAHTGEMLECNQALADLVGRSCEEILGQPQSILHPQQSLIGGVTPRFANLLNKDAPDLHEQQCVTKTGDIFDAEIKGTRLKLGKRDVLLSFFQDISERKMQQVLLAARLRLNEFAATLNQKELLQKFVDEAESMTYSKIGFFHFVNSDQEHLSLQVWSTNTLADFCKADPEEFHYPLSMAGVWVDCVRCREPVIHNDYYSLNHRKGLPEGHAPLHRELVVPLFNGDKIFAILGVGNKEAPYGQRDIKLLTEFGHLAWDIIARKGIEDQRTELELQLRQKYKMEAVGVMAGGIAHNFNNNLAIILGNLEMAIRKQDKPESLEKYLNNARTAVLRSRDLVGQILTYSHQDRKDLGMVDMCLVVKETMRLLKSTLPASVAISYSCDLTQLTVHADPGQIQEALINLCNNAVYAMKDNGELKIAIEVVDLQDHGIPAGDHHHTGPYACLAVKDNGCGIDHHIIDRIFDPFFTTKGVDRGTGMGLSTVKGIVEQHGGFIKVDSKAGKGTTFFLYFPCADEQYLAENALVCEEVIAEGSEYILLVDDDQTLLGLIEQMLTELGYRVTAFQSSEQAYDFMVEQHQHVDLLVTDQTMPGMTGSSLIRKIKSIYPTLPVILITGYSNKMKELEEKDLGINAFCMKPLGMVELSQVVRQVLDEQQHNQ